MDMKLSITMILVFVLSSGWAEAATFETKDDFTLTLPDEWVEIPREVLNQFEAALLEASQGKNQQKYEYGYQLNSAKNWLEYPYILVQVNRTGRVPEGQLTQYEKIEAGFDQGLKQAEDALNGVISGGRQGSVLYDEVNHILWSGLTMNVTGFGEIKGTVAIKLTEFGFIQVMGYADAISFSHYSAIFKEAVNTLVVAEEYQYKPRITDNAPVIGGINLGRTAIAALIGAIIGGVFGLAAFLLKKRQAGKS